MPSSRLTAIQVEAAVSNSIFRYRSRKKMKISTLSLAQPHQAKLLLPLALSIAFATVLGPAADIAHAQKRKKLTAPTVQVTRIRPDVAELTITNILSTIGTLQEYQVISGPNAAGVPPALLRATSFSLGYATSRDIPFNSCRIPTTSSAFAISRLRSTSPTGSMYPSVQQPHLPTARALRLICVSHNKQRLR